ncbi:MAG: hypothetical protein ACK4NX_00755, partial [Candidatus Paceibacteria bacterium]
ENEANQNNGTSTIATGDAVAASNVFNMVNTNLIGAGASPLFILIRVFGSWTGNIFSLPQGASWQATPEGITLFGMDFSSLTGCQNCCPENMSVSNTNIGEVYNNIRVFALTGQNMANNNAGNATIVTGNARAIANAINIVNTNILGRNWILAIINILGNWQGDIAFGRPNLWVGSQAKYNSHPAQAGSTITYTLTLKNNGDADATGVKLIQHYNPHYFDIDDLGGGILMKDSGQIVWDIGTVPTGATVFRTYTAKVKSGLPVGQWSVDTVLEATSYEDDGFSEDNRDILIATVVEYPAGGGAFYQNPPSWPRLKVEKTASTTGPIYPGGKVSYKIVVKSVGADPAKEVKVYDALIHKASGMIVSTSTWSLGDLAVNSGAAITYTAEFSKDAPPGEYINAAYARGYDNQRKVVRSEYATTSILVNPSVFVSPLPSPISLEELEAGLESILVDTASLLEKYFPQATNSPEPKPSKFVLLTQKRIEKPTPLPNPAPIPTENSKETFLASALGLLDNRNAYKILPYFVALLLIAVTLRRKQY